MEKEKETLSQFSRNFDIRKLAACTHGDHNAADRDVDYKPKEPFYILCGWMTEKDAQAFQSDISDDSRIFCLVEDEEQANAEMLSSAVTGVDFHPVALNRVYKNAVKSE